MVRRDRQHDSRTRSVLPSIVPAGSPTWITPELIETTIHVWQPYYEEVLTPEEAVTMILIVGRLYDALSPES